MYVLQAKLKLLKPLLKAWNINVFGNVHTVVDCAQSTLESVQLEISTLGFSEAYHEAELQEHSYLSQACSKWLHEGDQNTSYFHTLAKIRRSRNFICSLQAGLALVEDIDS